jgi:host factor-I protein
MSAMGSNGMKSGSKEHDIVNRKLIRPTLSEVQDQMGGRMQRKKPAPPDQTNAENFYYIKQMQSRTPMVVVLDDGEVIRGVLEWYDRDCIKIHRPKEPNLLIMKSAVRYMYKEGENKNEGNGDGLPDEE